MRHYKNYIWDFDGTLFDSYPHSARALYETMRHYGREADLSEIYRAMRVNFATAFRLSGLNETQLKLFHQYRGDDAFPPPIAPFPHAEAALSALKALGARHFLYTHSNRRMSVRFIEKYALDQYFTDCITADAPGFTPKPDPGAIQHLLRTFNISPADAVMVGDREIDMICARAANIDGILIDPEGFVKDTCATRRINDLIEIVGVTGQ